MTRFKTIFMALTVIAYGIWFALSRAEYQGMIRQGALNQVQDSNQAFQQLQNLMAFQWAGWLMIAVLAVIVFLPELKRALRS